MSREGYFKKITPQSLRMSGEQKFKEGDEACSGACEATNKSEMHRLHRACSRSYKARLSDFDDSKASVLGDYLPGEARHGRGRNAALRAVFPGDYKGSMLVVVPERQGGAACSLQSFETKTNRRRLTRRILGQVSGRRLLLPGR